MARNNTPSPTSHPPAGGLPPNTALPYTMHIDLNSCFAIIEQQANRLLRGRPVGVAAYDTPRGFVVAASYEAKAKGIKLGVNVEQARAMAPGIVIMTPDPPKYREAHKLFKQLMLEYTPHVTPKSIDEFVLDMSASPALRSMKQELRIKNKQPAANHDSRFTIHDSESTDERAIHNEAMKRIGLDMKKRIAESLGEWVTVNIGISTNRFLAKHAAGFGKPDGMTLIDHVNLRKYYTCGMSHTCHSPGVDCKPVGLMDLPGINTRYRARLRAAGIYTPINFLEADMRTLKNHVFKSIHGYHWYMRLRGHEVGADAIDFGRKSIGHQYALPKKTKELPELERLLMKLCEKTGRRMRKNQLCARGIHLHLGFDAGRYDPFSPFGPEGSPDAQRQAVDGRANQDFSKKSDKKDDLGPAGFNLHTFRHWSHGEKAGHRLYATQDIYAAAKRLLHMAKIPLNVKAMSVHVFYLETWDPEQLSLFDAHEYGKRNMEYGEKSLPEQTKKPMKTVESNIRAVEAKKRLSDSIDTINNRYGEFVITPAIMLDMQGAILDRIAFGQVKDL